VARAVEHPDVFLSYRRGPETAIAQRIFSTLTGPPFYLRVFYDGVSAPVGVDWKSYLANGALSISRANCVMVFISASFACRRAVLQSSSSSFEIGRAHV
jgi:hypothetical protein